MNTASEENGNKDGEERDGIQLVRRMGIKMVRRETEYS